jgi:O-antigen/teichoic acid export membrane protein
MSQSKKLIRGTLVLTLGQMASYGLSFARNVILARMLTKADFGLVAVFGMTLSLLEVAGRMSFGQQIIQSKEGDSGFFLASSHAFQFALAVVGALLIAGFSYPMACAFKVPHLTWAFTLLAAVPLAKSVEHLDYYRQQRDLNYLPAVLCELIPQILMTLAVWPLAWWLGDFRVIVCLMLGKAGLGVLMTHLLAERAYRWAWRRDCLKGMWLFGWPLLLNGLLMFASQQADQMVVGAFLSLDELASYALVVSLVSIAWFVFGQVASSLMLPILSRFQNEPEKFRCQYQVCAEYVGLGAVVLTLPLIIGGEQLVTLLFGSKYQGTGYLMALLGAASAVRFLRFLPVVAGMARADTVNNLISNLWRSLSLPLAVGMMLVSRRAVLIAVCALIAEGVATLVSVLRLQRQQGVPVRDLSRSAGYVSGFLAVELGLVCLGTPRMGLGMVAETVLLLLGISLLVAWLLFPTVPRTLWSVIRGSGPSLGAEPKREM